jgi:hypothetical protein
LLKKDDLLRLRLSVAKELGYTLLELNKKITLSELFLWSGYFELLNEKQENDMRRAKYR